MVELLKSPSHISEDPFASGDSELIGAMKKARAVFWVVAALSTVN